MSLYSKIKNKVAAYAAKRWAEKNLTDENIAAGAKGLWDWVTDPNIRQAIWLLVKHCIAGVVNEIKQQNKNEN